jgi:hypothetical protein
MKIRHFFRAELRSSKKPPVPITGNSQGIPENLLPAFGSCLDRGVKKVTRRVHVSIEVTAVCHCNMTFTNEHRYMPAQSWVMPRGYRDPTMEHVSRVDGNLWLQSHLPRSVVGHVSRGGKHCSADKITRCKGVRWQLSYLHVCGSSSGLSGGTPSHGQPRGIHRTFFSFACPVTPLCYRMHARRTCGPHVYKNDLAKLAHTVFRRHV